MPPRPCSWRASDWLTPNRQRRGTTTWSNDAGPALRQYSTTRQYKSYDDPAFQGNVGVEVPGTVTLYPLPDTMHVPSAERYSYSIINNNPVVVERTTRKVVHTWE